MASFRAGIPDFQLANPLYGGAQVNFFTVDESGTATTTLATLYAAPTGTQTLANPQTLDGFGKFQAPVYIDVPVIATVVGATVGSHTTGVIGPRGTWRGNWATATVYFGEDVIVDAATNNVYIAARDYTSGASVTADVTAGNLVIWLNFTAIQADATQLAAAVASATSEAATATTQAAAAAASATTATSEAGVSTTQAGIATTEAGIATTQAGISTTQAAGAAASAVSAAASAATAQGSGYNWNTLGAAAATTGALPACTYANGTAGVGATLTGNANGAFSTTDGVAAVLNNRYFVKNQAAGLQNGLYQLTTVGSGGAPFVLTRVTDANTAALLNLIGVLVTGGTSQAGLAYVLNLTTASITVGTTALNFGLYSKSNAAPIGLGLSVTSGTVPAVVGAGTGFTGGNALIVNQVMGQTLPLEFFSVFAVAAGAATLFFGTNNGDGTFTLTASLGVTLQAGPNTFSYQDWPITVNANWCPGVYAAGSLVEYSVSGDSRPAIYTSGLPGTSTAFSTGFTGPAINCTLASGLQLSVAKLQNEVEAPSQQIGPSSIGTGTQSGAGYSIFNQTPVLASGQISELTIHSATEQTVALIVASIDASNNITPLSLLDVPIIAGVTTTPIAGFAASRGNLIGVYAPSGVSYANNAGGAGFFYNAGTGQRPVAGAAFAGTSLGAGTIDAQFNVVVAPGLNARVSILESVAALGNGYVPPGTQFLTALPGYGQGLWGDGKLYVNGVRWPIPRHPITGNLFERVRANLAAPIGEGSPLVFVGDSITSHFYCSDITKDAVTMFTKWINALSAPNDEVECAVLMDSGSTAETAAFYGLNYSGLTQGATGPIGKSVIMAPSGYIQFNGNYAKLAAFYDQAAGAGTLQFSLVGTGNIGSAISAAGSTVLDKFTGLVATGQSTSQTYRLTNTGGANVTVTGLMRLGAVVSGQLARLFVMKHSFSGYQFPSFGSAQYTSIAAQAAFAGGSHAKAIFGLGTNDMLVSPFATLLTNANTFISGLKSAGLTDLTAIPIMRPGPGFAGSYSANCSYDVGDGAVRAACKSQGVDVMKMDGLGWFQQGAMYVDQLHPVDAGMDLRLQLLVEHLAGVD